MHYLPVNAIAVFIGGPNNGFIETGGDALFYAMDMELPKEGELKEGQSAPIQGGRSKVGRRIMMMPQYARYALQTIGMEKAIQIWGKYGVGQLPTPVYELAKVDMSGEDGDVFVYKYLGDHSEVFPEKK